MIDEQPDVYQVDAPYLLQVAPEYHSPAESKERVRRAVKLRKATHEAAGHDGSPLDVRSVNTYPSGTYYALNALTGGVNAHRGVVTVKFRSRPGEPLACLTCHLNDCPHTRFVREYIDQHPAQ